MKELTLINEIFRINQMMSENNNNNIVIENLLVESGTGDMLIKIAEKIGLYKDEPEIVKVIEKYVGRNSSKSIEERLESFIYRNMTTQEGKTLIKGMIRDAANINSRYANEFVKDYQSVFDRLLTLYKDDLDKVLEIIEYNYGENCKKAYERLQRVDLENIPDKLTTKTKQFYVNQTLRFFYKYWKKTLFLESETVTKIKIPNTIKQINGKINEGKQIYIDAEDLITSIMSLKKTAEDDFNVLYDVYVINNRDLSVKAKTKLKQIYADDPNFKALIQNKYKTQQSQFWGPVWSKVAKELRTIPLFGWAGRLIDRLPLNTWKSIFPDPDLVGKYIVWKDSRTFEEVISAIVSLGRDRVLVQKFASLIYMNFIIIPVLNAYFKGLKDKTLYMKSQIMGDLKNYESLKSLCELTYGKGNTKCSSIEQLKPKPPKDFVEYFKESLPIVVSGQKPYGIDAGLWLTITKDIFFWTYLDEIAVSVGQIAEGIWNFTIDDNDIKNYINKLNQRDKEALEKLPCYDTTKTPDENLLLVKNCLERDSKLKKDEIINKIENTPLGFQTFCLGKGLTIKKDGVYDYVSGQTEEFVPLPNNGGQSNNWYFDSVKNTFLPY